MRHGGKKHRLSTFQAGLVAIVVIVIGVYLGFTKDIPFTKPVPDVGSVRERSADPEGHGRPDRRRGRGQGLEGGAAGRRLAGREGHDEARGGGAPHPRGRRGEGARSGSSSRATSSWTSSPARRAPTRSTTGDTIPAAQTAAPVQFDQVLGSLQTNTRKDLQDLLEGFGDGLNGAAAAGRGRRPGPGREGRDRRAGTERLARLRARRAARHRDREPGHARPGAARPVEADRRPAEDLPRAREPRGAAEGPDHELQHDGRRRSRPRREPPARRSTSCPRCSRPRSRRSTT